MNQDYLIDQIVLYEILVDESVAYADDKIQFNYEQLKVFLNYKDDDEIRVIGLYGTLEQVQREIRQQINNLTFEFNGEIRQQERAFICGVKIQKFLLISAIFPTNYFLEKPIKEKSIEITLYRILQDLVKNIIFCPPQEIFKEWYEGEYIPFEESQVNCMEQYEIEENVVQEIQETYAELKTFVENEKIQYWKEVECLNQSNLSLRYKLQANNQEYDLDILNCIVSSFILHTAQGNQLDIERIINIFPDYQQVKVAVEFQRIQVQIINELTNVDRSFYHKIYSEMKSFIKFESEIKQQTNQICEELKLNLSLRNESFVFVSQNSNFNQSIKQSAREYGEKLTQIYQKYSKIFIFAFTMGKKPETFKQMLYIEILSYNSVREISNDLKYVSLSISGQIEHQFQIDNTQNLEVINILPLKYNSQAILIVRTLAKNRKPAYTFFLITKNKIFNQLIQLHDLQLPCFCWQSFSNKLFIFNYQENNIVYLLINEKGKVDEKVYQILNNELIIIKCAVYSNLSKQFILLTQQGKLYKWSTEEDNYSLIKFSNNGNKNDAKNDNQELYSSLFSSDNSQYYFLSASDKIDIYDQNFLKIHRIKLTTLTDVKIFQDDFDIFIFSKKINKIIVLKNMSSNLLFQQKNIECFEKLIEGNPYIDIIKGSQQSFGFTGQKAVSSISSSVAQYQAKLIEEYIDKIELKNYQHCGFQQKDFKVKSKDLLILFYSQVPLQICTIENQSIIPLVNGFKELINQEKRSTIQQQAMSLLFGFFENLQNLCNENLFVVSIVGMQSSGKSYLMNKLFGTKFSVSASRCTDGIWINFVKIQNSNFLIMDCEGLFSPRRTKQEESQFLALLAAVSDITILNQNLSFNRNLNKLFANLANSVGTLSGESLFQGQLLVAVRDVSNDTKSAKDELLRNLKEVSNKSKDQSFIKQLFNNKFVIQLLNNFQSKSFEKEIKLLRDKILEMSKDKKICMKDILQKIKLLLIQLQRQDSENVEKLHYELRIQDLYNQSLNNWHDFGLDSQQDIEFQIEGVILQQQEFILQEKLDEKAFRSLFEQIIQKFNLNLTIPYFNENIMKANSIVQNLLTKRKQLIVNNLSSLYSLFQAHVPQEILRNKVTLLENQLDQYQQHYQACTQKCNSCYLICSKCVVHNKNDIKQDINHDCLRKSHICDEKCQICNTNDAYCNLPAGHPNEHLCEKPNHKCVNKCEVGVCVNNCTMQYNHLGQHSCGVKHQCKEKCQYCNKQCYYDIQQHHKIHLCQNNKCDWMCYLCEQINQVRKCNQGHEHTKENFEKSHQCENDHQCFEKCQQQGICQIIYEEIQMEWKTQLDTFTYTYHKQIDQGKIPCQEIIKSHQGNHNSIEHSCKNKIHYCHSKCPECQCFCSKPYGHEGNHSSVNHRNKELQCFTTTENIKIIQIENPDKTVKKYEVSESSKPETCKGSCSRRGRSHFHLIRCLGGNLCQEKQLIKGARHQSKPYKGFEEEQFDEVLCLEFWKLHKWDNPVQDMDDLEKIQKCNCYCPDCNRDSFCIREAWHTTSTSSIDHKFICFEKHQYKFKGLDLVFVIDATGSMGGYIHMVKDKIESIMIKARSQVALLRCGIVAYRDHPPEEREFVTKTQTLSSLDECHAFLKKLKAHGGGDYPEAVLDGLDEAVNLNWKQDHNKIIFLIGDAPPHGYLYHNGDDRWLNGCPCKLKDTEIFEQMKKQKIDLKILALDSGLTMMIQRFKSLYNTIETIEASTEMEFGNIIENKIVGLLKQVEITAQMKNP